MFGEDLPGQDLSGEDELIAWLRGRSRRAGGRLIGDDAAILPDAEPWAVTTDTQIEGVHFVADLDPVFLARRLLAVNLSDLAAMGAVPAYAFLALAAPDGFDHRRFFDALLRAVTNHGLELAGGDLATSPKLTAVMTLHGRRAPGGRWLRRDTARSGEDLWLGGTVGESGAGCVLVRDGARLRGRKVNLPATFEAPRTMCAAARRAVKRHLLPRPQLELGQWLASRDEGAVMDVSDGVACDLHRLCRASQVGAEIEVERLPLAPGFRGLAETLQLDAIRLALGGGEDYVLLFTLPAGVRPPEEFGCQRVGCIRRGRGVFFRQDGQREQLPPLGWDHLATDANAG